MVSVLASSAIDRGFEPRSVKPKIIILVFIIPPLVKRGLYCNHLVRPSVCPPVHTFVKDVSAATGRNYFIFDT